MSIRLALSPPFFAITLVLVACGGSDDFKTKGPWDDMGPGSFVHQKVSVTTTGVPGTESGPPQVTETKVTLTTATDKMLQTRNEIMVGGAWQEGWIPKPRKVRGPGRAIRNRPVNSPAAASAARMAIRA